MFIGCLGIENIFDWRQWKALKALCVCGCVRACVSVRACVCARARACVCGSRFRGWCSSPYFRNNDCCNRSYGLCAFNRFDCQSVWSHVTAQSLNNQSLLTLQGHFWQKHNLCLIHTNTYDLPRSVKVNAEDLLCALVNPFCSVPESVKEVWSNAFTLISHSCLLFISLDFWILIPSAVHQFEECIKLNDKWKDCFVLQEGIHQYVRKSVAYMNFL